MRGLRATGKLQVTVDAANGSEIRRQRLTASQALLARAPDAFRLEALTPFGVGYVVATDGASIAAFAPGERVLWRGDADLATVAAATGVAAEPADVVALLLGVAPVPPLELSRARVSAGAPGTGGSIDDATPEILLHATVRDRPEELVVVGFAHPAAGAGAWVPVLYERSTLAGELVLRARFGDIDIVGDIRGQGLLAAVGLPVAGGGHAGLLHQRLGPLFAGLQLRSVGAGAEHGDVGCAQAIGQAGRQRGLRPHHHQRDGMDAAGLQQGGLVGFSNRQLADARQLGGAAVARRHPHALHPMAAGQGPGQGVLAAAAAHHQHAGGARQGGSAAHGGQGSMGRPGGLP